MTNTIFFITEGAHAEADINKNKCISLVKKRVVCNEQPTQKSK